ncbi:3-oxoacyl-[acyl-carrier-protein] reductase FabG [Rosistilla carotiformis]|uniref:3-oxoacyl-[acyl-carrier-protein] reductase FabG n=1 Tax=Rosistilla carotiformis TaxID=2528017 RepID=A0A518JRT2_9BACT|nr:SDR family NAD(P)-dependent oxidoreductase [Rosistilla carotiformis]QDV68254.1 3-oxoacyl-[acyl-carrier-protein] reductase FabG [Rosistilla carotiformis]
MVRWRPADATTIVTGASSGIGRELAAQLARRGATIVAVARRAERLQQLQADAAAAPGAIIPMAGDLTDPTFRQQIIDRVQSISPRLDLLVNNAGIGGIGPFAEATPQRLRQIMEVNFFAPVELTRLALPMLRVASHPVICNISSVLGHRGVPGKSEYCASKFAIHGWSDALRAELASSAIQVTLVSPSTTASEFFDVAIETESAQSQHRRSAMSPASVARQAIRAIEKRRDEIVLSPGGKLLVYLDRCCPWLANRLIARFG